MSMPMHLQVVVVGTNSKLAAVAASILRGDTSQAICPWISAAHVETPSNGASFSVAVSERKFNIEIATSYYFIDARKINLWLALDGKCAEKIQTYIMHNGPAPTGFYRGKFPDAVTPCGFEIPSMPSSKSELNDWLRTLVKNLEPWKQRIWDAFRDSS